MHSEGRVSLRSSRFSNLAKYRVYLMEDQSRSYRQKDAPHGSRVFESSLISAFQKEPAFSLCESVQQYTDANRQPTTPGQKRTRDRLKAIEEV